MSKKKVLIIGIVSVICVCIGIFFITRPRRDKDVEPAENAESLPGVYTAQEIEDAKQIVRRCV